MFRVDKKLMEVKCKIRWKKDTFGNIFGIKSKLQMELAEIQDKI